MFKDLYDLIVYVTNNYSSMPADFKKKFSEGTCVRLRLGVSAIDSTLENYEDDEK